ncbi:hypothetical protein ACFVKB_26640 [Rhodococcus sp. NPDC127530]
MSEVPHLTGKRSLAMSMDTLRTLMLRRKPLTENSDLVRNA